MPTVEQIVKALDLTKKSVIMNGTMGGNLSGTVLPIDTLSIYKDFLNAIIRESIK